MAAPNRHWLHAFDVRHWFDRYMCHGSFSCCRAVDDTGCRVRRTA